MGFEARKTGAKLTLLTGGGGASRTVNSHYLFGAQYRSHEKDCVPDLKAKAVQFGTVFTI
jgi:hypothetical protein